MVTQGCEGLYPSLPRGCVYPQGRDILSRAGHPIHKNDNVRNPNTALRDPSLLGMGTVGLRQPDEVG